MPDQLTIGLLGGTGPQGRGLAVRLALVGHRVLLGSRDPERAAGVVAHLLGGRDLPIEGREALVEPSWPKLAFVEGRLAGDPTNWWVPNESCVESMLRSCGLDVLERPGYQLWVCRPRGMPERVREELEAATGRN